MQTAPRGAHINVTPMIDVMLVLLIIFMVVVPVIALQVDLPVALNPQSKPEEPDEIVMIIDRAGTVSLEVSGRQVPGLALREQLTALYGQRTRDRILYVKADTLLPFGVLEQAMLMAREAGVRVVAAVTNKKWEPDPPPSKYNGKSSTKSFTCRFSFSTRFVNT